MQSGILLRNLMLSSIICSSVLSSLNFMSILKLAQSIDSNLLTGDRLSAITGYYIRKLLKQHFAQLTSALIDQDGIAPPSTDLYCSSVALFDRLRSTHDNLAPIVQTLEKLVLQHQTLRTEGKKYSLELSDIEEQIFSCFALKRTKATTQSRILIIDDTPDTLRLLASTLIEQGYAVDQLPSGASALDYVRRHQPDLILLDVMMPGIDGYEVCERLKLDPKAYHIPVLFLSAIDDSPNKVKAFELGGVDYVTKPFQLEEVLARVEYQLKLYHHYQQRQATIEANQPYKDFFENAIEGMFQSSISGQYLRVNQALARLLGYESSQDLIESIQDIALQIYTIPQRRSQFVQHLEQFGAIENFEIEVYCKNGDRIWIQETARAVRDSEQNLQYYEGTAHNITQCKQVQNQLETYQLKEHLTDYYN